MIRRFIYFLIFSVVIFAGLLKAQNKYIIKGTVLSATDGSFLRGANLFLNSTSIGVITDQSGRFKFSPLPIGRYELVVQYVGYSEQHLFINLTKSDTTMIIRMHRQLIDGPVISVEASRINNKLTPVTYSEIERQDLDPIYTTQDVPEILSDLPATTFYSEAGNGTGYNYLSIRGFDQRRISVLINGIPQNDPEDHNTYWVDFPDLLANSQDIQVRRGGGSAFYGPAAIGGSINILTRYLSPERKLQASVGIGSFNTQKYSASYNTGLLKNHFVFFGRFSNIKSDGYRDRAWINFWNYYLGSAYYNKKHSLRINFYGGPIEDGLVYNGLPKFYNQDVTLRRKNYSYWSADYNNMTVIDYSERRKDEIENFNQPHFEIFHEYQVNEKISINNSLFYIKGYGFFDFDGSWGWPEYFRLDTAKVDSIPSDALIRAYVDNNQFGWLPQFIWRDGTDELILGAEIRIHRSLHWGRLQKGAGLPEGVAGDNGQRYYEYKGAKDIISAYYHQTFELYPKLLALTDLQYIYQKYRFYDEKYIGYEFDIPYQFVNPRIGLNYTAGKNSNLYMNLSHTTHEPPLKNYYDAAESSGGAIPQFEYTPGPDSTLDFSKPLVKPETLTGIEIGYSYKIDKFHLDLNFYHMSFVNEIVKDGGLDQLGSPTTGNARHTVHQGFEAGIYYQILPQISLEANGVISKNILVEHTIFVEEESGFVNPINLDGNKVAGFPDQLANIGLIYSWAALYIKFNMKYVGKFYTDNTQNELLSVNPYNTFNLYFKYSIDLSSPLKLSIQGRINNLLDNRYLAHGIGEEFYPAAGRNWFLGLNFDY